MKIRTRTLTSIAVISMILLIFLVVSARYYIFKGFVELESRTEEHKVQQLAAKFNAMLSTIETVAADWAPWDDTYQYMAGQNEEFIANNLMVETLINLKINFMILLNTDGQVLGGKFVDLENGTEMPTPPGLTEALGATHQLLDCLDPKDSCRGIAVFSQGPVFLASKPVLRSDFSGPVNGFLVVGRFLNDEVLSQFKSDLQFDISVYNLDGKQSTEIEAVKSKLTSGDTNYVNPLDEDIIAGYSFLYDFDNHPILIMKASSPREIYKQGKTTFLYLITVVLFIIFVFLISFLWIIEKIVITPISDLSIFVSKASSNNDLITSFSTHRNDEFGGLARDINAMLTEIYTNKSALEAANRELYSEVAERIRKEKILQENEERLRGQNQAIVKLSKIKLSDHQNIKSALSKITITASLTLNVEIVSIWLFNRTQSKIECYDLYNKTYERHSSGGVIFPADYPNYFRALKSERNIAAGEALKDGRTRKIAEDYFNKPEITSILSSSIGFGDQLYGVIFFAHAGPKRFWTLDEENFAASIADITTQIIEANARQEADKARKKLENENQYLKKMEAIGTLAGGVAHDLNNILCGLVGYPDLLLLNMTDDSPFRQPIEAIKKSGERAAAIVQDLLTLARRGVSTTTVLNLNDIVREYLTSIEFNQLSSLHSIVHIDCLFSPDLFNMKGSDVHLTKTVMNLVTNAFEAMPMGGSIRISTENLYIDTPLKGYELIDSGEYVVLTVEDEGIGIKANEIDRVFEPFFTKKVLGRSGTGLGMAVVWGVVKDHNGFIDIWSEEKNGTKLTLYFPVEREAVSIAQCRGPIDTYLGRGETVLVVDDQIEQWEIAKDMLMELGYQAVYASSGESAIEHMSNNHADIIILDMIMEPGLDGLDTYKKILEIHPGQKAVIASGFSETDRVKTAMELGVAKYVRKPYTLESLGYALKSSLVDS